MVGMAYGTCAARIWSQNILVKVRSFKTRVMRSNIYFRVLRAFKSFQTFREKKPQEENTKFSSESGAHLCSCTVWTKNEHGA